MIDAITRRLRTDDDLRAAGFIPEIEEADDTQAVLDQFHELLQGVSTANSGELEALLQSAKQTAESLKDPEITKFCRAALIRLNRKRLARARELI